MSSVSFAVPGDLATPTGGYVYDRLIIEGLRALGWTVNVVDLGDGFPYPSRNQKNRARALLAGLPANDRIVIDGLAFGVLPEVAEELTPTHRLIGLVHHPLAYESGLSPEGAESLRVSERRALAAAEAVIVTSGATARLVHNEYHVPNERITVVPPGNHRVALVPREPSTEAALLAVGAVVPRKGYDVLVAALGTIRHLPWRLVIAGDCTRDPDAALQLKASIDSLGLSERMTVAGAVTDHELAKLYAAADLFVLPSRFEGYGMAISEAIAYGLPVVSTTAGAIPQTLPSGAGVLVPPDDVAALAAALRKLIAHPPERAKLAEAARNAARRLPSWAQAAGLFSKAIEAVA